MVVHNETRCDGRGKKAGEERWWYTMRHDMMEEEGEGKSGTMVVHNETRHDGRAKEKGRAGEKQRDKFA